VKAVKRDLQDGDLHYQITGNRVDGWRLVTYKFIEPTNEIGIKMKSQGRMVSYQDYQEFKTLDECIRALKGKP
jgi:hypothetical protein